MGGLGKHVERLETAEDVAVFRQAADIPGLCRGVAGDVDDPLRMQGRHPFQDPLAATVAGRIEDDHVGRPPVCRKFPPQNIGHIPMQEFRLRKAFPAQIDPRAADGLPVPFDAKETTGPRSEKEGEEARAAVCVDHRLPPCEAAHPDHLLHKLPDQGNVGLKEPPSGDRQTPAADDAFDIRRPSRTR